MNFEIGCDLAWGAFHSQDWNDRRWDSPNIAGDRPRPIRFTFVGDQRTPDLQVS
jgi:hypothetical protein